MAALPANEVRILGPLEVVIHDRDVALGGAKQRLVLAALVVYANTVVTADRLGDVLWGDAPPETAHATLQKYVHRLRAAFATAAAEDREGPRVESRPQGYQLTLDESSLDAARFATLISDASRMATTGDAAEAAKMLDEALALWRGPPWAEFADHDVFATEVTRLEGLRLTAIEDRAEAGLLLGQHRELIVELQAAVAASPLRERPHAQLMLALYRSGRQVEALRTFQTYRTCLIEEVGLEPSSALKQLEQDMVQQNPSLDLSATHRSSAAFTVPTAPPIQFPPALDIDGPFIGREVELDWLDVLWSRATSGDCQVALLAGPAGVGKTRLIARFARQIHDRGGRVVHALGRDAGALDIDGDADHSVLVVLDELDGAGVETAAVRNRVSEIRSSAGGLLVVAIAEDAAGGGELTSIPGMADPDSIHRRTLDGLASTDVAALLCIVSDPPSVALAEAVWAETDGNPTLVLDVGRRLRDREVAGRLARALARADDAQTGLRVVHEEIAGAVLARSAREREETPGPAHGSGRCPYKGLAAFDAADAALFCGRERLVATLVARLAVGRFVGVIGASGSGKSSLVRAGLTPALANGVLPGSERWPIVVLTPGADPLGSLMRAVAGADPVDSATHPARPLADDYDDELDGAIRRLVDGRPEARVVLIVDQFEELFTVCRDAEVRARFVTRLVDAAVDPDSRVVVVLVVRADYYGACAAFSALARRLEQSQVLVGAMTDVELRRAVTEPARGAGLSVEDAMTDAVCRDAGGEPGALPLVSTALLETWARRHDDTLTLSAYTEAGGVRGALARLADRMYNDLDRAEQITVRRVLLRLAEEGEGNDDVRRRASRAELDAIDGAGPVLSALVQHRLVTVDDGTVEVAHEALLREWPRLRGWLEEDREGRRLHRRLTDAAASWDVAGRDVAELYRGTKLDAAMEWRGTHVEDLNPLETAFVDTSLTVHEHERHRARRRTRRLAVLLVAAMIAAGLAVVQSRRASDETGRADAVARTAQASQLAALARSLDTNQEDLALLLAVEGHQLQPSLDTEGALETALTHAAPGTDRIVGLEARTLYPAVSPDGRLIAAPGEDGKIRLLDLTTGQIIRTLTGPPQALIAAFNPAGTQVVVGSTAGTVTVFDVVTGEPVGVAIQPGGSIVYGEFDPTNPTRLFTVSDRGEITIWDRSDPAHPRADGAPFQFPNAADNVGPPVATVSADGRLLAASTAGFSGSTLVWDLASGESPLVLPGRTGEFGPDGTTLPTSDGQQIRLWNARTGQEIGEPITAGLVDAYPDAVISPDGRHLADVDSDHTIKVYDLDTHQLVGTPIAVPEADGQRFLPDGRLLTVSGTTATIRRVGVTIGPIGVALANAANVPVPADPYAVQVLLDRRFVRGGTEVATFDYEDHHASLWNADTGAALGPVGTGALPLLDLSPDGTVDAVQRPDAAVELQDAHTNEPLGVIDGQRDGEKRATWNPAGTLLATTSSSDQTILLWDTTDPRQPKPAGRFDIPGTLPAGTASLLFPLFSEDGRIVSVVDKALSTVTVFDTPTRQPRWTQPFPSSSITQTAFTPDDTTLAISTIEGDTGKVTLWDVDRHTPGRELTVANTGAAVFARGGRVLVTGRLLDPNTTGTQLWDTATLEPIGQPLITPVRRALGDNLSPDSNKVMTGTGGNVTVIWDLDVQHWQDTACKIAGRNLSQAEWRHYLPGQAYRLTCPQWLAGP